jgi:hypothetical protein
MAAPNYTQSRPVTARQVTFLTADKTKVASGKTAYSDGNLIQFDKLRNEYYTVMTVGSEKKKVLENYWVVQDNATGQWQVWDPTSFTANHV